MSQGDCFCVSASHELPRPDPLMHSHDDGSVATHSSHESQGSASRAHRSLPAQSEEEEAAAREVMPALRLLVSAPSSEAKTMTSRQELPQIVSSSMRRLKALAFNMRGHMDTLVNAKVPNTSGDHSLPGSTAERVSFMDRFTGIGGGRRAREGHGSAGVPSETGSGRKRPLHAGRSQVGTRIIYERSIYMYTVAWTHP